GQLSQASDRGGERLRLTVALAAPSPRPPHASHHRRLVHVEARAPLIQELHGQLLSRGPGRFFGKNFLLRDHRAGAATTLRGTSKRPRSGSASGSFDTSNVNDLWALRRG